ncbi:MAG TPA: UDP-3-O-(3-hydroxymyristoyl)glucosamine N-acyltransferase [Gemmatimonadaceae bacterium]|nr:UDP-3-O-(3-hydroxymyristoyl)glucosamine N-acyltransferase [Gemmatimonadaceae bacterium]
MEQSSGGEGGSVLTAAVIAELTGGTVHGDAGASITSVAALDRARSGQLSFCASAKYARLLAGTEASVVLLSPDVATAETRARARIVVERPQDSLVSLLPRLYRAPERRPGVHPTALLGRGVRLGSLVAIGPYVHVADGAVLGDRATLDAHCSVGAGVQVGDDVHLFPSVTVYSGTQLGNRVAVHSGAVIGSDGFGYVYRNNQHEKIPHVGRCVIESDVEIGAGTTIDRGSIDDTVIGAGTKIDNLVHVAHNVRIGRLCLIAAQTGISGSVRIEDGVVIGGQAGLAGHHTIGKGARLAAQSGVFGDVPPGETWSGYPARPHRESLRAHAALFKLSGMVKHLERLLSGSDEEGRAR